MKCQLAHAHLPCMEDAMGSDELRVQVLCKQELLGMMRAMDKEVSEFANEIMRQNPTATAPLTILLGTILKAKESIKAIIHLGTIRSIDEMHVLLRTLVEMIVNTCYLQYSSQEELKRYIHFDPIAGHTALNDFMKATQGRSKVDKTLTKRTKEHAINANKESGIPLLKREWSVDARHLSERVKIIDANIGGTEFAELLATVYVTGSGYTHGGYKTLHKHAHYLRGGEPEHPLGTAYGVNSALYGAIYALLMFGRYLARRFAFSTQKLDSLGSESLRLTELASEDFRLHRESLEKKQTSPN